MKYDIQETKRLLKNNNPKNILNFDNSLNLLSKNFLQMLKIINIATLSYIIFSTLFYLIIHHYGKEIIKSKSVRLEYDSLLYQNLFVNFYFTLVTILGFISTSRRSISYFSFYFLTLSLYSVVFSISFFSNFYSDYLINKKFIYFSYFTVMCTFSIFIGIIFNFFYVIRMNKNYLDSNEVTASNIINEVNLRTDMLKINFNHFMIRMKLNKFIPSLMFKKDSFYFTNIENKKEDKKIENEKTNVEISHRNIDSDSTFYRTRDFCHSLEK